MSKRHTRPPVNLRDFLDKQEREGTIPIVGSSKTFLLRPPQLLSDDEHRALMAAEGDEVAQARIMLGDDYDEFVADGGSAVILGLILMEALEAEQEVQGADMGESGAS